MPRVVLKMAKNSGAKVLKSLFTGLDVNTISLAKQRQKGYNWSMIKTSLQRKLEKLPPDLRELISELAEGLEEAKARKEEFAELRRAIQDLTEAQRKAEERLQRVERHLEKVEGRLDRVEEAIERLAEAQRETEVRLQHLEETVERLAEAQCETEREIRLLAQEHRETRRQLGGLAATVGYRLEDEAFKALPQLLHRDYGIVVEGRLRRRFLNDREGRPIEVNIVGEANKNGRKLLIVGEAKSQLSRRDVDRFIRGKIKRLEGVAEEIFPVLVTYMISQPDVEDYARKKGIALYYSFDF